MTRGSGLEDRSRCFTFALADPSGCRGQIYFNSPKRNRGVDFALKIILSQGLQGSRRLRKHRQSEMAPPCGSNKETSQMGIMRIPLLLITYHLFQNNAQVLLMFQLVKEFVIVIT